MNCKKVVITGATGLLGSHLVVDLLRTGGYEVHCAVRSVQSTAKLESVCRYWGVDFSLVRVHLVDLNSEEEVLGLLREVTPLLYFHLAAQVSLDGGDAQNMVRGNVDMSEALTGAMYEYNVVGGGSTSLVFVSSIAAIGGAKSEGGEIDESCEIDHIHNLDGYSLSKFLSENVIWRLSRMGVPVTVVNPSVILGISGSSEGGSGIESALRLLSRGIPFYTRAEMGFVDVRDVAGVMRLLSDRLLEERDLDSKERKVMGERFIVSGGNHTYRELIGAFAVGFGKGRPRICFSRWAVSLCVGILGVGAFLVGRKPLITRSMIGFLTSSSRYSSGKLFGVLDGYKYHSLEDTVRMIGDRMKQK